MNVQTHDAIAENLRRIARTCEMSAGIMRDAKRTGGWDGAERTADQFDRLAERARETLDMLNGAPHE